MSYKLRVGNERISNLQTNYKKIRILFVRKYWKIWWRVVKMSLAYGAIYQTDVLAGYFTSILYFILSIFLINIFYSSSEIKEIAGFNQQEMILIFLIIEVTWYSGNAIVYPSADYVVRQIVDGGLDSFLLKPCSTSFLLSFQGFGVIEIVMFFLNLIVLIVYSQIINLDISFWDWVLIVNLIWMSILVMFIVFWNLTLLSFRWINFHAIDTLIYSSNIFDISRYPKVVYPKSMQMIFTYFLPIFLFVNPIYVVLEGSLNFWELIKIFSIVIMFVFFYTYLWQSGLKQYESVA